MQGTCSHFEWCGQPPGGVVLTAAVTATPKHPNRFHSIAVTARSFVLADAGADSIFPNAGVEKKKKTDDCNSFQVFDLTYRPRKLLGCDILKNKFNVLDP